MKDYRVHFKAIIEGNVYVAADNRKEAAKLFTEDPEKAFDEITNFQKYKILTVEET